VNNKRKKKRNAKFYLTPVRMLSSRTQATTNADEDASKKGP
jgi:hypothetical protein